MLESQTNSDILGVAIGFSAGGSSGSAGAFQISAAGAYIENDIRGSSIAEMLNSPKVDAAGQITLDAREKATVVSLAVVRVVGLLGRLALE